MTPNDIVLLAEFLVFRFGKDASEIAHRRATALLRGGNVDGSRNWRDAADLTDELWPFFVAAHPNVETAFNPH